MIFGWARRRGTAPIARDRLKILLTHERTLKGQPDLLGDLHKEIVAVICRHVAVSLEQVQVKMDCGEAVSKITIDVEVPTSTVVPKGDRHRGYPGALTRPSPLG